MVKGSGCTCKGSWLRVQYAPVRDPKISRVYRLRLAVQGCGFRVLGDGLALNGPGSGI